MRDREREMAEEMRLHLEHRIAQKIAAGVSPGDARAAALREFGNVEALKLIAREQRRSWRLTTVLRDVKFGLRVLRRNPGFALTAIVTLALGIGANVAVFSVVRAVLLDEPAFADPARVVSLWRSHERAVSHTLELSDIDLLHRSATALEVISGSSRGSATLRGAADPERGYVVRVLPGFFDVFGVAAARGRVFGAPDFTADVRPIVISEGLWRRQFAARADVAGQLLQVDGESWEVIGVMPATFVPNPGDTMATDVWRPLVPVPGEYVQNVEAVARLNIGASIAAAAAQATALLPREDIVLFDGRRFRYLGVGVAQVGSLQAEELRPGVLMLQGVAGLLLLIMCANLGNMFLAHASARRREFGVRVALGAGRGRIIGQLLSEAAALAAIGSLAGALVAFLAVPGLLALAGNLLPRGVSVGVTNAELVFALGLGWIAAMLFAGLPAWLVSRTQPLDTLRGTSQATTGSGLTLFRTTLVAAQVLLTLVLLVGAGLLLRSFARVLSQPLGFDPRGLVTAQVELPPTLTAREPLLTLSKRLDAELRSRFPADAVRVVGDVPFGMVINASMRLLLPSGEVLGNDMVDVRRVSPGAIELLGLRLVRGRTLLASDNESSDPVAVVNEAFVRRFAGDHDVLGARLDRGGRRTAPLIVGVVADARTHTLSQPAEQAAYFSFPQSPSAPLAIAIRGVGLADAAKAVREAVRSIDPNLAVTNISAVEDRIFERERRRSFYLSMLALFAGLALVLAAVGIYGVVAHVTSRRGREMGIRLALGAKPRAVVRLVVRQSLTPIGAGLVGGVVTAWWLAQAMQTNPVFRSQLFQVTPRDPLTFVVVPIVLVAVALVACWIPARRAAAASVTDVIKAE